jgi:hypothetical protein
MGVDHSRFHVLMPEEFLNHIVATPSSRCVADEGDSLTMIKFCQGIIRVS